MAMNASRANASQLKVPLTNADPLSFIKVQASNAANSVSKSLNGVNKSATFANSAPIKEVNKSLSEFVSPIKDSAEQAMENTSDLVSVPIIIGIGVLIVALILIIMFRNQIAYGFQMFWNYLKNGFSSNPAPTPDPASQGPAIDTGAVKNMLPTGKEVFNISDNKYKYSDAEPLCKAYGAELATYDQVKDAWNKGADWCNYGWIKGQSAVYPTQDATYQKLQAGPEDQRGACGIPGVNGGYFDNPDLRFGVNCYGVKPAETDTDDRAQMRPRDMTNQTIEYDRKVRNYKQELNQIPISPFNSAQWA
jgi:hypothetical protein